MCVALAVIAMLVGRSWCSIGDEEGRACESENYRHRKLTQLVISTFTFTIAVAHGLNYISASVEVRDINACIAKVHYEKTSHLTNYKLMPTLCF